MSPDRDAVRRTRSHARSRRLRPVLVVALAGGVALPGCTDSDATVGERSRQAADAGLALQVARTQACLQEHGPGLWATGGDTAALTGELMDCAGTTILNLDDEGVLTVEHLYRVLGSIAISAVMVDGEVLLTMFTQESAVVQSGVTSERTTLATCWQVAVDEAGELGVPSGVPCSDVVVSVTHPTEVLPLDTVEVPSSPGGESA